MQRLRDWHYAEAIQAAFDFIPSSIVRRIEYVHFLCGVDPVYVGLEADGITEDKRSYRSTEHWCPIDCQILPKHLRHGTIVLQNLDPFEILVCTIVHELGHVLDEAIPNRNISIPDSLFDEALKEIRDFVADDWEETFAIAFQAYCLPISVELSFNVILDKETTQLFDAIEEGKL